MVEKTQVMTIEVTFVTKDGKTKSEADIKKLLKADDVHIKNNKIFEMELSK